jgi:hypothetical protein
VECATVISRRAATAAATSSDHAGTLAALIRRY